MKYHWNSQKIHADICHIPGVGAVFNDGPGGDVDTDTFRIEVAGTDEFLYVKGFETGSCRELPDKSDVDVDMVELTDGLCSSGGLNSNLMETAQLFILVRAYFINHGADVVDTLDVYF